MFTISALLSSCSAHLRSVADLGEGPGVPPPSYFWTKLSPEGPKKIWGDQAPPVVLPSCLRVWVTALLPPPPPPCLYLKVWIRHLKMDYCFGSSILKWEYWLEILNEV